MQSWFQHSRVVVQCCVVRDLNYHLGKFAKYKTKILSWIAWQFRQISDTSRAFEYVFPSKLIEKVSTAGHLVLKDP